MDLHRSGKWKCDIICKYDIVSSLLGKRIVQSNNTGSFKEKDNRMEEQQELIEHRKQNKQLKIENDILKQATQFLFFWKIKKWERKIWRENIDLFWIENAKRKKALKIMSNINDKCLNNNIKHVKI